MLSAKHGGDVKREHLIDYAVGAVTGLAAAYLGLSVGVTLLFLVILTVAAFVTPYYIRRFIRHWKQRNA